MENTTDIKTIFDYLPEIWVPVNSSCIDYNASIEKIGAVIDTCTTKEQFAAAREMINNFGHIHLMPELTQQLNLYASIVQANVIPVFQEPIVSANIAPETFTK